MHLRCQLYKRTGKNGFERNCEGRHGVLTRSADFTLQFVTGAFVCVTISPTVSWCWWVSVVLYICRSCSNVTITLSCWCDVTVLQCLVDMMLQCCSVLLMWCHSVTMSCWCGVQCDVTLLQCVVDVMLQCGVTLLQCLVDGMLQGYSVLLMWWCNDPPLDSCLRKCCDRLPGSPLALKELPCCVVCQGPYRNPDIVTQADSYSSYCQATVCTQHLLQVSAVSHLHFRHCGQHQTVLTGLSKLQVSKV